MQATRWGKVYLVGAGTGDPELLTVKALRLIHSADVIFYDRLVSVAIRNMFPKHTPARYVGKARSRHSISQRELNRLMTMEAKKGLTICRLKGGDPFVFGRGGEEMLALRQSGIAVEVVPGITAASACASYAGIPLTHRGVAQACSLVAGHGQESLDIDWAALASMRQTIVFYMGLASADSISVNLIAHGLSPTTPVALVERGSTQEQRVVCGNLEVLPKLVVWHRIKSPALIVIGDVVNLAKELKWFTPILSERLEQMTA